MTIGELRELIKDLNDTARLEIMTWKSEPLVIFTYSISGSRTGTSLDIRVMTPAEQTEWIETFSSPPTTKACY